MGNERTNTEVVVHYMIRGEGVSAKYMAPTEIHNPSGADKKNVPSRLGDINRRFS